MFSFFFLFAKRYSELLMTVWTTWFPHSILGPAYSITEFFHIMAGLLLLNVKYLRQIHMKALLLRRVTIYLCSSTAVAYFCANYLGNGLHVERALHDHFTSSQKDWSSSSKHQDLTWAPIITSPLIQLVQAILPKNGMNIVASVERYEHSFFQIVHSKLLKPISILFLYPPAEWLKKKVGFLSRWSVNKTNTRKTWILIKEIYEKIGVTCADSVMLWRFIITGISLSARSNAIKNVTPSHSPPMHTV